MGHRLRVNLPEPLPGLVIRYNYLWRKDELEGFSEGDKDRPAPSYWLPVKPAKSR